MTSFRILAGCATLLFVCTSASAQDTQVLPRKGLHLRSPGAVQFGPRLRGEGPRLGVRVDQTPDGLMVKSVDEASLAASAGVKPDDILLRIGDHRLHAVEDVALALQGFQPGAEVELTVVRPGEGLVALEGTLPEPKVAERAPAPDGMKGGFLGVQMKADDERGDCGGVAVGGVVPDSAAWFAGLDEGDCLLSLDGKALASAEDLAGAVASKEPGALVELRFRRNGDEQTTRVRLGHRGPAGMLGFGGAPGAFGSAGDFPPGAFRFAFPQDGATGFPFDGGAFKLDLPDVHGLLDKLPHGLMDDGGQSVEVRIEDDHMTVTKDGVTEHYELDAGGNWIKSGTPAEPQPSQDT